MQGFLNRQVRRRGQLAWVFLFAALSAAALAWAGPPARDDRPDPSCVAPSLNGLETAVGPESPPPGRLRSSRLSGPNTGNPAIRSFQEHGPPQPARVVQLGQPPELERQLEEMLEEAEKRRATAPEAPQLGVGLGARLAALNPNISVIGDFVGQLSSAPDAFDEEVLRLEDFHEGDADDFRMRHIELLMSAAADPYADGLLKVAFTEHGVHPEEAYLLFHSYPFVDRLPAWLADVETKAGIFRMNLGPVNLTDNHDLPTVDRPLVLQQFFGGEGLIRPGLSWAKPLTPRAGWVPHLFLEFTNGQPVGEEEAPTTVAGEDHPLGLVHVRLYREDSSGQAGWLPGVAESLPLIVSGHRTLELGLSFLATGVRPEEAGGEDLWSLIQGLDLMWTWADPRPDVYREWMIQGELYVAELEHPEGGARGDVGTYLLVQHRWQRQWYGGLRLDLTEFPLEDGHLFGVTPYVTYFITEFNRIHLQYQFARQVLEEGPTENAHTVWLQFVFAFGAHPPEPYYIRQRF
jgi:hypothetical protein